MIFHYLKLSYNACALTLKPSRDPAIYIILYLCLCSNIKIINLKPISKQKFFNKLSDVNVYKKSSLKLKYRWVVYWIQVDLCIQPFRKSIKIQRLNKIKHPLFSYIFLICKETTSFVLNIYIYIYACYFIHF